MLRQQIGLFLRDAGFMFLAILALAFGNWRGRHADTVAQMFFGMMGGVVLILIYFIGMATNTVLRKLLG